MNECMLAAKFGVDRKQFPLMFETIEDLESQGIIHDAMRLPEIYDVLSAEIGTIKDGKHLAVRETFKIWEAELENKQ